MNEHGRPAEAGSDEPRRSFLTTASGALMTAGLALGYGTFGVMLARFVYPAASRNRGWMFVCTADSLARGQALDFTAPAGARIVIARQGPGTAAEDFLALSSVCPHLGCQVHWEAQNDRFFCPCHNGAFDKSGNAIAGPPKAANQTLVRFPVKVEDGLLYVEVPLASLAARVAPDEGGRLS
jgi:Rieske Fe-S protein